MEDRDRLHLEVKEQKNPKRDQEEGREGAARFVKGNLGINRLEEGKKNWSSNRSLTAKSI